MNQRFTFLSIAILAFSFFSDAQAWKSYPYSEKGSAITFPADEGYHPGNPVEWWYTNAHITGKTTGTNYSYMLTYFHYPKSGYDGYRIFDMSNETSGQFITETQPCKYSILSQDHLNIQANTGIYGTTKEQWSTLTDTSNNLLPFQYHVKATSSQGGAIDLVYTAVKRPLMIGGTGFLMEGSATSTYYYSQTDLDVTGTITLNGVTEQVGGTAWIDRQWGAIDLGSNEKYAWFSLQLSNGTDLNLWNIFNTQNQIPNNAYYRFSTAYINETTSSTTSNFTLQRLKFVYTTDSVQCYDQKWRLQYGNTDLIITAAVANAKNEVTLPFRFFEGSVGITGTVDGTPVTGIGYAELLHSFVKPQIAITAPTGNMNWSPSQPITWQLSNPDDGRPIYYDATVSTDNKATFSTLAKGILDTAYRWTPPTSLVKGTQVWFKINAYSIDSTLNNTTVSSNSSTYDNTALALDDLQLLGKSSSKATNTISWNEIAATNAVVYKILRSIDGINFVVINTINTINTNPTTAQTNYQYIDTLDTSAQNAINFYYQVSAYKNGQIGESSNIIIIKKPLSNPSFDVTIYPNPASTDVEAIFYAKNAKNLSAKMIDEHGREMQATQIFNISNGWDKIKFSVAAYPAGIYYLLLNIDGITKSYPLIKN